MVDAGLLLVCSGGNHIAKCSFGIEAFEAFEVGISNDGYGAIAGHTVGLAGIERPDGELAVLVVDAEHGIHHVGNAVGEDEGVKGV